MSNKYMLAVAIAMTLIGWAIASTSDWHEEQREVKRYCDNVAEGYWPDFKEIYDMECKK